jgi:LuxR family maltose regulon positive regulatory protein
MQHLALQTDWPWSFKVYVFGPFQVLKGDAPIRFSRRAQRKTFELLQALIAFGGTEVAAGSLIDALWPDSEGDAGYHALESALYRLRLLLGIPSAVTMAGSKLTLDRRCFWVDMWAFERELRAHAEHGADALVRFAGIRELYRGHFLEQDSDKPWALKTRQTLRNKFLRSIRDAARVYENRRLWEEAANVYQVGIELDGMAEDLYRRLMICHRELGEHIEVLQVYCRCREFLIKVLGVQPNPKTQAIYHSVRENIVAQTG